MVDDNGQGDRDIYDAVLEYAAAEAEQAWTRFNAMLVAHTILIAVAATLLFGQIRATVPIMAPTLLLVAGLIVCFAWWAAIERAISYQDRYVAFAKRLEERFLGIRNSSRMERRRR